MLVENIHGKNIDLDMIGDLATDNTYWQNVQKFLGDLQQNHNPTQKQLNWLDRIENDYEEAHTKINK